MPSRATSCFWPAKGTRIIRSSEQRSGILTTSKKRRACLDGSKGRKGADDSAGSRTEANWCEIKVIGRESATGNYLATSRTETNYRQFHRIQTYVTFILNVAPMTARRAARRRMPGHGTRASGRPAMFVNRVPDGPVP